MKFGILDEIKALEELLVISEGECCKSVINDMIESKWQAYFKQTTLSSKNQKQVELMKYSYLSKSQWIMRYAKRFSEIYKETVNIDEIAEKLYGRYCDEN